MINNEKKLLLFLVDDDALFLKALEIDFIQNTKISVRTFATGELCLENIFQNPDIIVSDYSLNSVDPDAINGLETLDKIKSANPGIKVVMLSSQDKIEVAVDCMKHKAFDYIVKSETAFMRLQNIVSFLLLSKKKEEPLNWYINRYHSNA